MEKNKKVVVLGGGTGTSTLLRGLKYFPLDITAVLLFLIMVVVQED
mgnify:CR=1 FL=1